MPDKCLNIPVCCDDYDCPIGYSKDERGACIRRASCGILLLSNNFFNQRSIFPTKFMHSFLLQFIFPYNKIFIFKF